MRKKIKQYRNLILLVAVIAAVISLFAADPLGYAAKKQHERAAIRNQIAVEKAEAEKQVAILQAEKEAEVKRIEISIYLDKELQEKAEEMEEYLEDTLPEGIQ